MGWGGCLHKEDFRCILVSCAFLLIFLPFALRCLWLKQLLLSEEDLEKNSVHKQIFLSGMAQMATQIPKMLKCNMRKRWTRETQNSTNS